MMIDCYFQTVTRAIILRHKFTHFEHELLDRNKVQKWQPKIEKRTHIRLKIFVYHPQGFA